MENKKAGTFIPDTIALVIYGLPLGYLVFFLEKEVLQFTKYQWLMTHIIYLLHYPAGRLCAKLDDFFRQYFGLAIAGALALCFYSTPIYMAGAIIAGVAWQQVLLGCLIQVVINTCFGWLYGLILEFTRRAFDYFKQQNK